MIDNLIQAGTFLSVVAFFLLVRASSNRRYRRAWFIQFMAQPFWLASTFIAHQWVMFAVSLFFTVIAIHGVLRFHGQYREEKSRCEWIK